MYAYVYIYIYIHIYVYKGPRPRLLGLQALHLRAAVEVADASVLHE